MRSTMCWCRCWSRIGYMQQAARIKGDVGQVRDEARIEAIVSRA
jgi:isochorismate pyruvate lyase